MGHNVLQTHRIGYLSGVAFFLYLEHCSLESLALLGYNPEVAELLHVQLDLGQGPPGRVGDGLQQQSLANAELNALPGWRQPV